MIYYFCFCLYIQTMNTFMPPPPVATFLAFHPQDNNIIAIGMDDSSIQIYNVRVDEVKTKLKGHNRRITGLAFSNLLNVLVSSGADSQKNGTEFGKVVRRRQQRRWRKVAAAVGGSMWW